MAGKMGRKIIFLDIDGTLTAFGTNRPPESAVKAIAKARRNGHLVFLCTGRNRQMHYPMLQYGMDGAVGAAGALAYVGEERIWSSPIGAETFRALLDAFHAEGISCMPECEQVVFADPALYRGFRRDTDAADSTAEDPDIPPVPDDQKAFLVRPASEYAGEPVYKMVFLGAAPSAVESLEWQFGRDFQFIRQKNMSNERTVGGEVIMRGVDKALGMLKVCEYYGLPMSDTIAFGDSSNDIEMLDAAGISVCMGNGSDDAKAAASLICPDVRENGLAEGFGMLGLT